MSQPIVSVVAGLYYFLGSVLLLKKLVGAEENDWLVPETRDRPTIDTNSGFGLLGFSAGLYGLQKIPDSNISKPENDAWTVKLPWEVHLRRKPTPSDLYDPMHPYWTERAHMLRDRIRQIVDRELAEGGSPPEIPTDLEFYRPPPLVKEARFEVRGEWMDLNPTLAEWWETVNSVPAWRAMPEFVGSRVSSFAFSFKGDADFSEVTLGEMANKNKGALESILIGDAVNPSAEAKKVQPEEKPIFFDFVHNSQAGVTHDWILTFRNVHLVPTHGLTRLDLARWFDYEEQGNVCLEFDRTQKPSPLKQIIDYEW